MNISIPYILSMEMYGTDAVYEHCTESFTFV
jgi:hypothetical protein